MNRETFIGRLKKVATSQAQACRDLAISQTTMLRWEEIPGYAVAYLVALETYNDVGRLSFRHNLALERLERKDDRV